MIGEDFREDYEYDEKNDKIGQGSYGTVYRVKKKDTNEKRAIKLIDIEQYKLDYENYHSKSIPKETLEEYTNLIFKEIRLMQVVEGEDKKNEKEVMKYQIILIY